ncbi:MAG: hypothetical protein U5L06_05280 [Rhodovibrio sp.]|nr:hypothetical protein [Rhodovibrio sp.]
MVVEISRTMGIVDVNHRLQLDVFDFHVSLNLHNISHENSSFDAHSSVMFVIANLFGTATLYVGTVQAADRRSYGTDSGLIRPNVRAMWG